MNQLHQEIVKAFQQEPKHQTKFNDPQKYSGNSDFSYGTPVPLKRIIAKKLLKEHPNITFSEYIELLNILAKGQSHEEKTIIGHVLGYHHTFRAMIEPQHLEPILDQLYGWEQVDSVCQSVFTAEQICNSWSRWKGFLEKLSFDTNINKRRASLVLLTGPVKKSDDNRLADHAFITINTLKREKEILITKAISWLLRSMVQNHKNRVEKYLANNAETLPKVAVRETKRKIETGKK